MYDKNTKILSVMAAVFLFIFLTETLSLTGVISGRSCGREGVSASVECRKEEDNHTKDENVENRNRDEKIEAEAVTEIKKEKGRLRESTSEPRVIQEQTLIKKRIASLSAGEFDVLCRIVQAEAGGEDMTGKQMVADVIINRVCSPKFPNSVSGVVFQQNGGKVQFSPVRDGRYYSVNVTEETREAVSHALNGTDSTNGALYFVNASKASPGNLSWFESCLTLQAEHGGHRFYR